uniref:AlNc14C18G1856 protein n=1 Tax=Albugo laibachii Nc14 TaxID=890382 RepID=F0W4N5_9STRA|nr:AlNc14C18G1856 [Albugo laibachii Nc14]|eukprot:CCA16069.1 AlNc14C18G1856 [Albugo laibachii Nc14]
MKITFLTIASFSLSAAVTAQAVPNGLGGSSDAVNGAQNTPSAFQQIEGQATGANPALTASNQSSVPDNKQPLNADYSSLVENPPVSANQTPPAAPHAAAAPPADQLMALTISSNPSYQSTNPNPETTSASPNTTTTASPSGSSDAVPTEDAKKDTCSKRGWVMCSLVPGCHWTKPDDLCQSKAGKVLDKKQ